MVDDGVRRLKDAKDEINKLKTLPRFSPEFKTWQKKCERLISSIYGSKSVQLKQFSDIRYSFDIITLGIQESEFDEKFQNGLLEAELLLDSFLEETDVSSQPHENTDRKNVDPKKIFVVHGHDEVARRELVELLEEELHLEPIVLMDEASGGKTVIEKFEDHTLKIGYAIILLTPDDLGCLKDDFEKHESDLSKSISELKLRSRENVILELGYFIGKLRREGVCCICKDSRSLLPSDLHGIIPIIYRDSVREKFLDIKKELINAGYVK